ncbi:MAG: fumarate hydratase [Desulfurococcales archaeon]|nr:fumarate hydratase [Desulfurococcales archaeon]
MWSYTERASREYLSTGTRFPREILWAMGIVKAAAAHANYEAGLLSREKFLAIREEALALAEGRYDSLVTVDVYQTGSGTGLNLNVNEVIASKALENHGVRVHPLDDVNMSQSSNDVVPTAIRLASARVAREVGERLTLLYESLRAKEEEFSGLVKPGRTHLRDALPVTLGQELSGYSDAFLHDSKLLSEAVDYVLEVPLGGTAVGTGANAPEGYRDAAIRALRKLSGLPVRPGITFRGMKLLSDLAYLSSAYKIVALELWRLGQDIRLMYSGPFTGIAEIDIGTGAPGSSIMPGKKNPVTIESIMQASATVKAYDETVVTGLLMGELELSMAIPLTGYAVVNAGKLLVEALEAMATKVLPRIRPRPERMKELAVRSAAILTVLSPRLGYDRVARIAERLQSGASLEEALGAEGISIEEVEDLIRESIEKIRGKRGPGS